MQVRVSHDDERMFTVEVTGEDYSLAEIKKWLLKDAKPGDRLVLHFSGHGSQIPADHEEDGVAEMICLQNMDFHDPSTFLTSVERAESNTHELLEETRKVLSGAGE